MRGSTVISFAPLACSACARSAAARAKPELTDGGGAGAAATAAGGGAGTPGIGTTGAGAATMGSPVNAVVWLANTLGHLGIPLKAGEVILSGALGAMVPVQSGDNLRVTIGGIGTCAVRFS